VFPTTVVVHASSHRCHPVALHHYRSAIAHISESLWMLSYVSHRQERRHVALLPKEFRSVSLAWDGLNLLSNLVHLFLCVGVGQGWTYSSCLL
jgi:hypothetical protein